jgi:hypothetical protein
MPGLSGTPAFVPGEIRIPPYGIVFWSNYLADSVDVTFDGPVVMTPPPAGVCNGFIDLLILLGGPGPTCGIGDALMPPHGLPIPGLEFLGGTASTVQVRQFPEPGIYPFHSTRTGLTGTVVVTSDL